MQYYKKNESVDFELKSSSFGHQAWLILGKAKTDSSIE